MIFTGNNIHALPGGGVSDMGKVEESGQVMHRDTWSSKCGSSGSVLGISPCTIKT